MGKGSKTQVINENKLLAPEGAAFLRDAVAPSLTGRLSNPFTPGTVGQNEATKGAASIFGGNALIPQFGQSSAALNAIDFSGLNSGADALRNFDGTQQTADTLAALQGFAGQDQGANSQVNPLLLEAAQGRFLTQGGGNPFLEDFIAQQQRLTTESFNESVLPSIASQFSGAGGFNSSTRGAVTAQAARDLQRTLADQGTQIGFNVYEAERGRQVEAQQILGQIEQQNLQRQLESLGLASDQATTLSGQRLQGLQGALQGQLGIGGLQVQRANVFSQQAQAEAAAQQARAQGLLSVGAQNEQRELENVLNRLRAEQLRLDTVNSGIEFGRSFGTVKSNSQNLEQPRI
jgi:hypothetical protein